VREDLKIKKNRRKGKFKMHLGNQASGSGENP
jgi:hypothetical protein